MSRTLKLLLICFLTATVLSAKYRVKPNQDTMTPPNGDATNQTTNATNQGQPGMEGNATKEQPSTFGGMNGNISGEQEPTFPGMEGNETKKQPSTFPGMNGNISGEQEPTFPGMEGNETKEQPSTFPGMKGNISGEQEPTFPGMESNETKEQPRPSRAFPGFPDIEGIINETFGGVGNKTERKDKQKPPSSTGEQGIPAESPSETGAAFASSTIVNVDKPVISVNGQALGTIQPDLIKIGVVIQNQGDKAGDLLGENEQTVNALISKIKELGIREQSILNLGQMFRVSARATLQSGRNKKQTNGESTTEEDGSENGLVSYSQLEVQANDIATAGKIIDLIKSEGNQIKYIDFGYQPETLAYAVNNLITLALNDAENRAKGGLSGTGYQIGKLLNININVNPDFKNYMNDGQQGIGANLPAAPKIIKVVVSATYAMEPKTAEEQPTPQTESKPQSPETSETAQPTSETPAATPGENNTMNGESTTQVTSGRKPRKRAAGV